MSNTMRWRYGDTNPIVLPVNIDVTVEIGDLIYLEVDDVRPAIELADQGTLVDNQELFHDQFIGIAMQSSVANSTDSIRIATSGVFEFDCPSSTFEVGDLLGVIEDITGTKLERQKVVGVATPNLAVGRCVKQVANPNTRALVDIVSTIVRGGPQAAA